MTTNVNATPVAPKRKWYQKLYHNSFVRVAVVGGGIAILSALALRSCGPKQEIRPNVTVQTCCPPGFKQVERGINNKNEFVIRCVPIPEPICNFNKKCESPPENAENCPQDCPPVCGDGFITHKEECDTKSSKPNQGCKDDKKECKSVKNTCKCVEKIRPKKCGDKICDKPKENAKNCPEDCPPECEDKICSTPKENVQNCPQDCPPICGDGFITHKEDCDTKSDKPNKGCPEDKTCNSKCKCNDEIACLAANAVSINSASEKAKYGKIIFAAHAGVGKYKGMISDGTTVKVDILVCPPGNAKGSAKVISVRNAGVYTEEVKKSVNALLSNAVIGHTISEAKKFTEDVDL